jgi:hypothetical protein
MQLFNTKVVPSSEDALWSLKHDLPSLSGKELLVLSAHYPTGSQEELTLHKMIAACKLSMEQYEVVQLQNEERLSWSSLITIGIPPRVLLLGVQPAQLGINALFRLNMPNTFMGITIIPSLPLNQIEASPELKKELWLQGLKPGFGL